jgi:hypothetical protein
MKRPSLVLAVVCPVVFAGAGLTRTPADVRSYKVAIERYQGYALLLDPVVAAELKLTDIQTDRIKKVSDEVVAKHKDDIAKAEAADKFARDALTAQRDAQKQDAGKKADGVLAKHLSADQLKRLGQLEL